MVGSLRLRLFISLLVPVAATGGMACLASFSTLQGSYRLLLGERLAEVADNLSNVAEATERIGQALASQSRLQRLIEQAKSQNTDLTEVSVILEDGRIVFDTDLAAVGQHVPATWLPQAQLGLISWSRTDGNSLIAGSPIVNSFRRPLGAVVVRVSGTLLAVRKVSAFRAVALVGLVFLAVSAAACYAVAAQLARQIVPAIQWATADIDRATALMRGNAPTFPQADGEMDVVARIRTLAEPLDAAERAFRQMDDAA